MKNEKKFGDPLLTAESDKSEEIMKSRFSKLYYSYRRKKQILFIFYQYSLLKIKPENLLNLRLPQVDIILWKKSYFEMLTLNPLISRIRQYNQFYKWNSLIRIRRTLERNFIQVIRIRKRLIFKKYLSLWARVLQLKRYYESIPVFSNEDLKLRAYRAFCICRNRRRIDNIHLKTAKETQSFILLTNAFEKWRKCLRYKRVTRYLHKQQIENMKKMYFINWIKCKRMSIRLTFCFRKAVDQKMLWSKYRAFRKWQFKYFDAKEQCKKASYLVNMTHKQKKKRIFRNWIKLMEYQQFVADAEHVISQNSSEYTWKRCFSIWFDSYKKRIDTKAKVKNQFISIFLLIKKQKLCIWRKKFQYNIEKRKKFLEVQSRINGVKLQTKYFENWKEKYQKKTEANLKWRKAVFKWHSSIKRPFFRNWHFETMATNQYKIHLLRCSFASFIFCHQKIKRYKILIKSSVFFYVKLLLGKSLSQWQRIVADKKEMRYAQHRFRTKVILDCFIQRSHVLAKPNRKLNTTS